MKNRIFRYVITYILFLSFSFTPVLNADQLSLPSSDLIAPIVKHTPLDKSATAGESSTFSAIVTDNVAVQSVILFYRAIGDRDYKRKAMQRVADSDRYQCTLTAEEMVAPGIEYFIQASDPAGNNLLHGYSFSPLVLNVDNAVRPAQPAETEYAAEEESSNKWLWIGLGVLAIAAAAGGGGGGGGGSTADDSGTVVVNAPLP